MLRMELPMFRLLRSRRKNRKMLTSLFRPYRVACCTATSPDNQNKNTTPQASSDAGPIPQEEISDLEEDAATRYAAYARTARIFAARHSRYLAYTSDVGEALRPVAAWAVKGCYALSWGYVMYEIAQRTSAEYSRSADTKKTAIVFSHALVFQSVASMLLPSFIIHSVVKYSDKGLGPMLKNAKLKLAVPSVLGLLCIPLMPYVDKPVEEVIDKAFDKIFPGQIEHEHHKED